MEQTKGAEKIALFPGTILRILAALLPPTPLPPSSRDAAHRPPQRPFPIPKSGFGPAKKKLGRPIFGSDRPAGETAGYTTQPRIFTWRVSLAFYSDLAGLAVIHTMRLDRSAAGRQKHKMLIEVDYRPSPKTIAARIAIPPLRAETHRTRCTLSAPLSHFELAAAYMFAFILPATGAPNDRRDRFSFRSRG